MGIGPIPWTAIVEYAEWHGLDRDVAEAFVDIMREMDSAYMGYHNAEQKKASDAQKKPKLPQRNT